MIQTLSGRFKKTYSSSNVILMYEQNTDKHLQSHKRFHAFIIWQQHQRLKCHLNFVITSVFNIFKDASYQMNIRRHRQTQSQMYLSQVAIFQHNPYLHSILQHKRCQTVPPTLPMSCSKYQLMPMTLPGGPLQMRVLFDLGGKAG